MVVRRRLPWVHLVGIYLSILRGTPTQPMAVWGSHISKFKKIHIEFELRPESSVAFSIHRSLNQRSKSKSAEGRFANWKRKTFNFYGCIEYRKDRFDSNGQFVSEILKDPKTHHTTRRSFHFYFCARRPQDWRVNQKRSSCTACEHDPATPAGKL